MLKRIIFLQKYSSFCVRIMPEKETSDENITEVYEKAHNHWNSVTSTVNGMLGGFAQLHIPDINGSKQFICSLKKAVSI